MDYPITRSWWETLTRTDLEQEAAARGQQWKAGKGHVSFAVGLESLRDTWELRGSRPNSLRVKAVNE